MAKDLAREIGYVYIDTGAMYRAVTLYCLQNGLIKDETVDTEELKKRMGEISITFLLNPTTGKPDTYLNDVAKAIYVPVFVELLFSFPYGACYAKTEAGTLVNLYLHSAVTRWN